MDLLRALHSDVQHFILETKENQDLVVNNILTSLTLQKQSELLKDAVSKMFADAKSKLEQKLNVIQEILVENLIRECSESLRQVNDLPRLYRKTNREPPTRCSIYIEQMLKPLILLAQQQQSQQLGESVVNSMLEKIFTKLTEMLVLNGNLILFIILFLLKNL